MIFEKEVEQIKRKIIAYQNKGLKLFSTSSFQSQSLPLLHILSGIKPQIPVYMLNTGFLFPESIAYKNQLVKLLDIQVIELRPETPKNLQKDSLGNLLFVSDPDHCCYVNKIQPLEKVLAENDIWINGVRADQSKTRGQMDEEMEAPFNSKRYHPMLSWTAKMIYEYSEHYNLPKHPLEDKGYVSIGCEPCTRSYITDGTDRKGRWFGMAKTECGLHTDLAKATS